MGIRAVLWDVDDTIFDYARADRAGMQQHLASEGLVDGYASVDQALGHWRKITDQHWARFSAGETDWEGQRRDRVRSFVGRQLSDADADAWFDRYIVHYEAAWSLFPDAVPALDLLAADYRHAVLSNSSLHNQERKLRILGVRDRFEAVVCAAELGVSKPEAAAFHAACKALGLPPGEVVYVGDQPDIDARGAVDAGLAGIWLDRTGLGGRPELIRITGLDQLPGLLRGDTRFGAPDTFG
ncbi:HAD family hydrolase [Streptomyces sp. CA-135486]|uniref:HAD family hydrolase n=1 Tax=Streptomyces sp. CA-135486 TaxID=3240049 RepID=UPI003D8D90D6